MQLLSLLDEFVLGALQLSNLVCCCGLDDDFFFLNILFSMLLNKVESADRNTCLNSRLVLRPAPYQAPVAVIPATAPVVAKIRALFGVAMLDIDGDMSGL